jgi:hypothetical protein
MRKQVTICFRTSEGLRIALEKAAREDHRSLSSLIELTLTDYIEKNHEVPLPRERRLFVRRQEGVNPSPM